MDSPQAFGEVVRGERKRLGLTQDALAVRAGLHINYIGLLERGRSAPALDSIFAIATALGLRPSKLLVATEQLLGGAAGLHSMCDGVAALESLVPSATDARGNLARNLVRLRGERGLSQAALASKTGLHRTFIGQVERQARNIALDNIERLARGLDVKVAELLR